MKYCIIIADGMADEPVAELAGKTPLEVARTPNMDELAGAGRVGQLRTIPLRMRPDSDVAILSILGYDPRKFYGGRAPFELLGLGRELSADATYFRCNFVTVADGVLTDHTAGHVREEEAQALIGLLNSPDGIGAARGITFLTGMGYRCFIRCERGAFGDVRTFSPQDILGKPIRRFPPKGRGAEVLRQMMERSRELFAAHDINRVRADLGESPVSMIWPWGQSAVQFLPSFEELHRKKGAAVAAVPLVRGIALAVGWAAPTIPGATGYYDTDYAAKARHAVALLEESDIVLVHVESPDEASHEGDIERKIECIEKIDLRVVGPLLNAFRCGAGRDRNEQLATAFRTTEGRILLLPDHATSVQSRKHLDSPVPFAIWGKGVKSVRSLPFNEPSAARADLKAPRGHELMAFFLRP